MRKHLCQLRLVIMTLAMVFNAFIARAKGRHPNAKDGLW